MQFTYVNKPLLNFLLLKLGNLPSKCNRCQEQGANVVFTKYSQWNRNAATASDAAQLFVF